MSARWVRSLNRHTAKNIDVGKRIVRLRLFKGLPNIANHTPDHIATMGTISKVQRAQGTRHKQPDAGVIEQEVEKPRGSRW